MSIGSLFLTIIDIAVVTVLFYRLLLLLRGTRAVQMIIGLLAIIAISFIAGFAHLETLNWIASNLKTVWIIAFLIIFQPELRRALAQMGQSRVFRRFVSTESFGIVGHIVSAAEQMSKRRVGGIVVIAQSVGLKNYLETGVRLNSDVTGDLLVSIFNVQSPLHDGAVIIEGDQLAASRCILPLTQARYPGRALGTRHRAALGLSEETDAIIVVVSEESGQISIASDGKLTRMKNAAELRSYLSGALSATKPTDKTPPKLKELLGRGGVPGLTR